MSDDKLQTTRFYVVASNRSYDPAHKYSPDQKVFTVSTNPDETGWETDSGCQGYGLTRAEATFLADAANEKIARGNV